MGCCVIQSPRRHSRTRIGPRTTNSETHMTRSEGASTSGRVRKRSCDARSISRSCTTFSAGLMIYLEHPPRREGAIAQQKSATLNASQKHISTRPRYCRADSATIRGVFLVSRLDLKMITQMPVPCRWYHKSCKYTLLMCIESDMFYCVDNKLDQTEV